MSTKITQLEKKINENPNNVWANVHNVATGILIDKVDAAKLRQHGDFEKYLKHLFSQGVLEVQIDPRKKNGTSSRKYDLPFNLNLGNKSTEQPSQIPQANQIQPQATNNYPSANQFGLMGGQQVGLGQLLQGQSAIDALARLERDFSELKMKYENLKTEKERIKDDKLELQRKNDQLQYEIDKKGPLDSIDVNQLIKPLLGMMSKGGGQPGLNAAQSQLSPAKQSLKHVIEHEGTPDDIVNKLFLTIKQYIDNNENFVNQFEKLVATANQNQNQPQNQDQHA